MGWWQIPRWISPTFSTLLQFTRNFQTTTRTGTMGRRKTSLRRTSWALSTFLSLTTELTRWQWQLCGTSRVSNTLISSSNSNIREGETPPKGPSPSQESALHDPVLVPVGMGTLVVDPAARHLSHNEVLTEDRATTWQILVWESTTMARIPEDIPSTWEWMITTCLSSPTQIMEWPWRFLHTWSPCWRNLATGVGVRTRLFRRVSVEGMSCPIRRVWWSATVFWSMEESMGQEFIPVQGAAEAVTAKGAVVPARRELTREKAAPSILELGHTPSRVRSYYHYYIYSQQSLYLIKSTNWIVLFICIGFINSPAYDHAILAPSYPMSAYEYATSGQPMNAAQYLNSQHPSFRRLRMTAADRDHPLNPMYSNHLLT